MLGSSQSLTTARSRPRTKPRSWCTRGRRRLSRKPWRLCARMRACESAHEARRTGSGRNGPEIVAVRARDSDLREFSELEALALVDVDQAIDFRRVGGASCY